VFSFYILKFKTFGAQRQDNGTTLDVRDKGWGKYESQTNLAVSCKFQRKELLTKNRHFWCAEKLVLFTFFTGK